MSFGCVDVAVHDAGCTLSVRVRTTALCVVWSLSSEFFTNASLEKNALTKRDNYNPRRQAHPVVEWGELRRSRRLSRISFGANPSPEALDDAQTASDEARCWDAHAGVVSSVQVVARPQAIVTAGEDGMARVWTWEGEPIGLMDVNAPEGNGIPWHFRTAAFEEHGSNGEASEMLLQAKAAAAFYAGMKSRATRDEKARARQIALTKLKQGTPEGLEDLASHTIRSRLSPPRSPITSHRKSTLVIEDVSTGRGLGAGGQEPDGLPAPRWRTSMNPHDTASEGRKGWDAVFNGINALEEQNRANELALNSPSKLRRRRSIRGAIKTGGKTWRTLPSLIDLSHLASELPGPPGRCDPPAVSKAKAPRPCEIIARARAGAAGPAHSPKTGTGPGRAACGQRPVRGAHDAAGAHGVLPHSRSVFLSSSRRCRFNIHTMTLSPGRPMNLSRAYGRTQTMPLSPCLTTNARSRGRR